MIKWVANHMPKPNTFKSISLMNVETVKKVRDFHRSFPQYSITPLAALDRLANETGVGGIYVKDESRRFGLNSFKALGATFALASFIAETVGRPVWELDYNAMTSPDMRHKLGDFTFFATTDGNHGRAVAWAARQIMQKAVIYMPKGCPQIRLENIRREGAEAYITGSNYDDTIRYTASLAANTPRGVIVQDTAWEGYEDFPGWIMQGYGVLALEACEQLTELGVKPTHMLVQAGVGAFAGSAQGLAANFYGNDCPATFVVEPNVADCHYRSALKGDGSIVNVSGNMDTIMAGLACGEPNILSWDILKNICSYFVTIDDNAAARGMRVLGAPLRGDPRVISGESGASSMGFLMELLTNDDLSELRRQAGINADSHILLFSSEGDTDPGNYRNVVWNGKYSQYSVN
jgi:diaminopropionate ammonia-lyase